MDITFAKSLELGTQNQAVNTGEIVDRSGFGRVGVFVFTGTITAGTHTMIVEHSDTREDQDFTNAEDFLKTELPVLVTGGEFDKNIYKTYYTGGKRYVRVSSTVATPGAGGVYGGAFVLGLPAQGPATYTEYVPPEEDE